MELLQLRYFKEACESENFSAVANKYMVPQPSISKTIKKLENELGVLLFDRNGKKISLNGNGRYFYDKVSTALNNIDEGVKHFSASTSNIVVYTQAGSRFVSLLSADFLTSHENIFLSNVNFSSELKNKYDFTFMQILDDMSSFCYENLMKDEIVAVVSSNHPYASKNELSIKELKEEVFVGYYRSMNLRDFTDNFCKTHGNFTPVYVFETNDYTSLRYMIEKNKGISLMPKAFFDLQPGNCLVRIPLKEKVYRLLCIAWNKNKILNDTELEFLEYTKNWFSELKN